MSNVDLNQVRSMVEEFCLQGLCRSELHFLLARCCFLDCKKCEEAGARRHCHFLGATMARIVKTALCVPLAPSMSSSHSFSCCLWLPTSTGQLYLWANQFLLSDACSLLLTYWIHSTPSLASPWISEVCLGIPHAFWIVSLSSRQWFCLFLQASFSCLTPNRQGFLYQQGSRKVPMFFGYRPY